MSFVGLQGASSAFTTSQTGPAQLDAVKKAAAGLSNKVQRHRQDFCKLLEALLHPDAEMRMTAAQMNQLHWLQEAAQVPLPKCPIQM